jgi:hypothetical protein
MVAYPICVEACLRNSKRRPDVVGAFEALEKMLNTPPYGLAKRYKPTSELHAN